MVDLLVVGDCNPDLLLSGGDVVPEFGQAEKLVDQARLLVGGSAAIVACGAARLGLSTALVAVVGADLFGRFMLDALTARGVDVSGCITDRDHATGITVALVRGDDRAMLTSKGTIPLLTADHLPPRLWRSARHIHVASYFLADGLRPGLPELVSQAREAGVTVSVDPQGDPSGGWDSGLRELAPSLDLLLCNEQEDRLLAAEGCPLVVVKRGARGASLRSPAGTADATAPPVQAVDATGAGDSFDAGFLAGWLGGLPPARSLELACVCGALSTRELGGIAAQPTLDEVRAAMR